MWIAFKSDDSVEYIGFQAAFHFFDSKFLELLSCIIPGLIRGLP